MNSSLSPFIVAHWDGTHIWLQWDAGDAPAATGYEVRLRFRKSGETEWEPWKPTIKATKPWLTYPSNRLIGTQVQGEVRPVVAGVSPAKLEDNAGGLPAAGWERAVPAKFVRSRCLFEISSQQKDLHYVEGMMFHCHVDGAACSYRLTEEIEINAGETRQVELEAVASSGYAQLDKPGDFLLRPGLGITIRNVAPSHSDVEPMAGAPISVRPGLWSRDFAVVDVAPRDGPVTIAFMRPEAVR